MRRCICMYIHIHIDVHVHIHVHIHIHIHVHIHVDVHVHVNLHLRMITYTFTYAYTYTYMNVHMHIYLHIHRHLQKHTHAVGVIHKGREWLVGWKTNTFFPFAYSERIVEFRCKKRPCQPLQGSASKVSKTHNMEIPASPYPKAPQGHWGQRSGLWGGSNNLNVFRILHPGLD